MMRKLWMLMALCIMMAVPANAEEKRKVLTSGAYEYVLLEDGTAEIKGHSGEEAELEVPAEVGGYAVSSIGAGAFFGCSNLTRITLPETLTSIGANAFCFCGLTRIALPDGLTSIGDSAFYGCSSLASITLPDSLASIGDSAFSGCSNLTRIALPDSITEMGDNPFNSCAEISFLVSPDHSYLAVIDGILFSKPDRRLVCCPNKYETYRVPSGIACIGEYAFSNSSSLRSIILPDSLTSIGDSAFSGCRNLTSILLPDSLKSIGGSAFSDCSRLKDISLPKGLTSIGDWAFSGCFSLTKVTLPDRITEMGKNPFRRCDALSFTVSPDHPYLTVIDGVLFSKPDKRLVCCPNQCETFNVPPGIVNIGEYAFDNCSSLTSITLPDGLTNIGDGAFSGCSDLKRITLPDSVTSIGGSAFWGCDNLTVTVERNSYPAEYCKEKGLSYTYPDANDWLNDWTVESVAEEAVPAGEGKDGKMTPTPTPEPTPAEVPAGPMSYADFMAAEIDTPVIVETYVQAKQAFKDGKVSVYAQSEDGGYFIYGMECSGADYEKLTEGQKITVTGFKGEWSGEIEIMDATFELADGTFVATEYEANELLGAADIDKIMNQRAAFDELTIEASKDSDGREVPFLYNWDGSGAEGNDIYFIAGVDGKSITFVVETDLTPADSEVYKAAQNLKIGDEIDLSAFMYWYEGPEPHVYKLEKVEVAENIAKTTTDCNFRAEPDIEGDNVIDELDEGTEVRVLGREGNFFKVEYEGQTGYISLDYLE